MFYKRNYALRTLSMWRVRSSILLEKPHSFGEAELRREGFSLTFQALQRPEPVVKSKHAFHNWFSCFQGR